MADPTTKTVCCAYLLRFSQEDPHNRERHPLADVEALAVSLPADGARVGRQPVQGKGARLMQKSCWTPRSPGRGSVARLWVSATGGTGQGRSALPRR